MSGWGSSSNATAVFMALSRIKQEAEKEMAKRTRNFAATILRTAKRNCPVKSGNLKKSGRLEPMRVPTKFETLRIIFGGGEDEVDYAYFQEVGTSSFAGKFYLLRAVRKHSPELVKYNKDGFEYVWDKEVKIANLQRLV